MSDNKAHNDLDKNAELISKIYSESNQEQPPEVLDAAILEEAHQAVTVEKKQFLSTPWKAGLSMAAVIVVGLAVVLEVGVVTYDKGVFEKAVNRDIEEDQMMDTAVVADEAPSGSSESNSAPIETKRHLKQRAMPSAVQPSASGAKQQPSDMGAPLRSESATEAETTKESRAPQKGMAQDLSNAVTIKIKRPERWISEIQKLIEQGEDKRAAQEIKKFERYYPDVDLNAIGITVAPTPD
jgi:hypothetical protein